MDIIRKVCAGKFYRFYVPLRAIILVGFAALFGCGPKQIDAPVIPTQPAPPAGYIADSRVQVVMSMPDGKGLRLKQLDGALNKVIVPAMDAHEPSISPDGKQIAFCSMDGGSRSLFILNITPASVKMLYRQTGYDVHSPSWSTDQKTIYLSCGNKLSQSRIYKLDIDSAKAIALTGESDVCRKPAVSISTGQISYAKQKSKGFDEIWSMDQEGKKPLRMIRSTRTLSSPSPAPNGDSTACVNVSHEGKSELLLYYASSAITPRLAPKDDHVSNPSFSPDGKWVVYQSGYEKQAKVFRVRIDGTSEPELIGVGAEPSLSLLPTPSSP